VVGLVAISGEELGIAASKSGWRLMPPAHHLHRWVS